MSTPDLQKFEKVTEENLEIFLKAFYDAVQEDDLIGPVFTNRIGTTEEDWAPHMIRVNQFWCSLLLAKGQFKGKMVPIHNQIPGLQTEHFKRWMEIFTPIVNAHYAISPALDLIIKAQTVMRTLHKGYTALQRHKAEQALNKV
jgi:hemoglobin